MSRKTRICVSTTAVAALAAVTMIALAAAQAKPTHTSGPKPGGTYRVAFEQAFGFTDGFDPTGEYYTYSFDIFSNLMIRTLVGYDHVAGPAGNVLVPDIATSVPKPTNGGKTYTFHLKQGVKFGPPGQPRGDLERHPLRDGADRPSQGRRRVRLLLLADRRLRCLRRRQGEDDRGDQDAEREHDRLRPDRADR